MIDQITKLIAPLHRRVRGMVARGILRLVDDAGGVQRVQVQVGPQTLDGIDRPQMYGFTSHPPAGGEVVVVFVGGNRDQGVVIGEGDRAHRPQGLGDATAIYDHRGQIIVLSDTGIEIRGVGRTLRITGCPKIEVDGDIEATGDIKAGDISLRHHLTGGVQPGTGDSGEPHA